jgi:hypothetical protein
MVLFGIKNAPFLLEMRLMELIAYFVSYLEHLIIRIDRILILKYYEL